MNEEVVYEYTNDTWYDCDDICDYDDDYPPRDEIEFECYNAVGWYQNGSAPSLHQLYCDILLHYEYKEAGLELSYENSPETYLYQVLTIQDFLNIFERKNIKVIEAK